MSSLTETIDHVKTNLMPDYDYDEFARSGEYEDDYDYSPKIAADAGTNYNSQGAQDNVETNWD